MKNYAFLLLLTACNNPFASNPSTPSAPLAKCIQAPNDAIPPEVKCKDGDWYRPGETGCHSEANCPH